MADVGPPMVKLYDSFYYDNIILMAPSFKEAEIANDLKVADIMEFFEAKGHNLMLFGDLDARRHTRKIATNFGVDFENFVSSQAKVQLRLINPKSFYFCSTSTLRTTASSRMMQSF